MGVPEQEIVVTGTVKSVDGDRVVVDTVAAQGENQIIQQRRGGTRSCRARAPKRSAGSLSVWRAALPRIGAMLSERQELILRLVVDAYLASAQPVPSKEVAERPEVEWGAVDGAGRAGGARGGGLPDPSAHLGRPGPDRRRLPLLRRPAAGVGRAAGRDRGSSWSSRGCAARSTRRCGRRPRRWPRSPTWSRWRPRRRRAWRRRSTGSRSCACSRPRWW